MINPLLYKDLQTGTQQHAIWAWCQRKWPPCKYGKLHAGIGSSFPVDLIKHGQIWIMKMGGGGVRKTYQAFSCLRTSAIRILKVSIWRQLRFCFSAHSKWSHYKQETDLEKQHVWFNNTFLWCTAYWGNWSSECKSCAAIISLTFSGSAGVGGFDCSGPPKLEGISQLHMENKTIRHQSSVMMYDYTHSGCSRSQINHSTCFIWLSFKTICNAPQTNRWREGVCY